MTESQQDVNDRMIDRLILSAAADDLEPFEWIESKLSRAQISQPPFGVELAGRLFRMLAEDLLAAYLLHADPPYITPVSAQLAQVENYWFYITDKGKKFLDDTASTPYAAPNDMPQRQTL